MSDFLLSLSAKRACVLLLFFTLFLFFTGLDQREPESGDETRVAGISTEMVVSGDYLVPHLNTTPFLEYPPLCYWAQCLCLKLIKNPLTALKIPSAISALLAAFFIFFLSLKLHFSPWQALLSSGLLITGIQFFLYARCLMVDMMLSAFIAGSFFSAYALLDESIHYSRVSRFLYFLLFVFMLAGGVMTKGLFGLAVPLSGIGIWLIVRDIMDKRFRFYAYFMTGLAVLAAAILTSLWYGAIYYYRGYQLFYEAFWVNNFGRFSGTQGDHVEGFFYYFPRLPGIFFPWLWFALAGLLFCGYEIKNLRNSPVFYPVIVMLVPFLLLCVASSKRQVYLLPLYAPAAICAMYGLFRVITLLGNLKKTFVIFQRFSLQKILLFMAIFLSLFPIAAFFITKNFLLPFSALFLIWISYFLYHRKGNTVFISLLFSLSAIGLIYSSVDAAVAVFANPRISLRPLFEQCRQLEDNGIEIVLVNAPERTRGAAFFYLHHSLKEIKSQNPPTSERNTAKIIRDKHFHDKNSVAFADKHKLILPLE